MRARSWKGPLAVLLAVSVVFAGCGDDDDDDPGVSTDDTEAPADGYTAAAV